MHCAALDEIFQPADVDPDEAMAAESSKAKTKGWCNN
jgi:hypothetical protein